MFKGIIYLKCCKLKISRIDDKSAENEKCINYQPIKIIRFNFKYCRSSSFLIIQKISA